MIPFNKPFLFGNEIENISQAHINGQLAGDGPFTKYCEQHLSALTGCKKALLTHSCTAALEMCAMLADIREGDEVIMPSYTFVSTANAFVLRGAKPIFIDIKENDLNINESLIEAAISKKTKAIVPVHYAGVSCNMQKILEIARAHKLLVIEDAAQAMMSISGGRHPGAIGDLGAVSFHETKNIISGEGGAIIINNESYFERAEILREKGTNRAMFNRGTISKYRWVDQGSSYLPGELIAAFLAAQLDKAEVITRRRLVIWNRYYSGLKQLEESGLIKLPQKIEGHNAHMFYIILHSQRQRDRFIKIMRDKEVYCVFHYVPLHSSPFGLKVGESRGSMEVTDTIPRQLVRMPLWLGIEDHLDWIISETIAAIKSLTN